MNGKDTKMKQNLIFTIQDLNLTLLEIDLKEVVTRTQIITQIVLSPSAILEIFMQSLAVSNT